MDAVELVAGPAALGRVKLTVVQPDRSVRRVSVQPEFQTGHAGKVRAKRGRGQGAVAFQRYLHEVLAFTLAHRYVFFSGFHRVRKRRRADEIDSSVAQPSETYLTKNPIDRRDGGGGRK